MATHTGVDKSFGLAFGAHIAGNVPPPQGVPGTQTIVAAGAGTFVWPENISAVTVECWGSGAGGGGGGTSVPSIGGGGGAYARSLVMGIPGQSYPYVVGAAGTAGAPGGAGSVGGAGADTSFNSGQVLAKGASAAASISVQSIGGQASASVGDVKFNGGSGSVPSGAVGAGGGSSAGTAVNGNNGQNTGTAGVAPTGGGPGGQGGSAAAGAAPISGPGGGGGGGAQTFGGGVGRAGQIKFTW